MDNQGQTIGSSIVLKFIERFGTQIVNIVLNIILARLLVPEDYGVLAILNVFVVLAQVISQNGINNALVQKSEPDELDYSTALYLSLAIAGGIYSILFVSAQFIAAFYSMSQITLYLRVLGVVLFPGAICAIYNARVMKKMQFRIVMVTGVIANISACVLGVITAYYGFGVWSLIITQMASAFIALFMMMFMIKERFSFEFSSARAKSIMSYGNKIIIASIIDNIYYDAESLLIGKILSKEVLGFFTNARTYPLRVVSSIQETIASVIFSALANEQHNIQRMREIHCKAIQLFSFLMFPMLFGFAAVSREFISVMLTDKWMPCLVPMQAFSIGFAFIALSAPNIQVIKATGKSDLNLEVEMLRKVIIFIGLLFSIYFWGTIEAISIMSAITTVGTALMVAFVGGRVISFSLVEQLNAIFKNIMATLGMMLTLYAVSLIVTDELSGFRILVLKVFIGAIVYFIIALITKNESLKFILDNGKVVLARLSGKG